MTTLDFLLIGAEKCGTTWLADMLRQHPGIFIPPEKEIFYFNRQFFESPELENFNHSKPLDWYYSFFAAAQAGRVKGEASPAYIWDMAAPEKIHAFNPALKLVAVLRDPVERAFSQYRYYIQRGVLGNVSFAQAIELRPEMLSRGMYHAQLTRYYALFPAEQILVLFFDDIKRDNQAFLHTAEAFLGVEPFTPPNIEARSNVTGEPRFKALNQIMSKVRYWVRKHDPPFVLELLRRTGLAQWSERLRLQNTRPAAAQPAPDPALVRRLRAHFREDVLALERLTGRDLKAWIEDRESKIENPQA